MWCGASKVEVAHIDGNETNTTRENLGFTCRPCNQKVAAVMKRAGVGRRTHQFNPKKRKGATSQDQYAWALAVMRGNEEGDVDEAVKIVQETPHTKRSD